MKGQTKPYNDTESKTQKTEVPVRLYMGVIYLVIGLILYLLTK